MTKFVKSPLSIALVSALLASTNIVMAAGFQIGEHSAAGIGRANAGDGAIADDASVIASNPALMTQLKQPTLTAAITYVEPDVTVDGTKTGGTEVAQDDIVPSVTIPSIFYVQSINDKLSVGIGAFTNFGLKSQYDDDFTGSEFADTASITTININPSIAYKLNDSVSLGLGLNYLIAEAEFSSSVAGNDLLALEGDGTDYGWNAGLSWQLNPATMIGLSYRSGFEIKLTGDASSDVIPAYNGDGELVLDLPEMANLSVAHQLNDTLQLSASIDYTNWSTFEKLEGDIEGAGKVHIKDENWTEAYRYSVGATYQFNPKVKLRGGIAYDESPVEAEYRTLSIPDSNRVWYSTGANFMVNDKMDVDVAYTYIDGEEVDVTETSSIGTTFTGTSEGNANIVSLQLNTRF
jgi:long-chain fatty acid transport protein